MHQDGCIKQKENIEASPQLSLEDIKQGTQNFSHDKCVGNGKYWKLYEGQFPDANADGYTTALVKRWDKTSREGRYEFLTERKVLSQYKNNDSIVGIEGYCNEKDEKIIVYEYGYIKSLDKHLDDARFSWTKRLRVCMNVALVLHSLYSGNFVLKEIKSGSILIDSDWNGKVSNLESSLEFQEDRSEEFTLYYYNTDILLAVLLEILRGRLDRGGGCESYSESLKSLAKTHNVSLDDLVFEGIKEKVAPESLNLIIEIVSDWLYSRVNPRDMVNLLPKRLRDARIEQEYIDEIPQISLEDIKLVTHDFSDEKCIGEGRHWKLYEGEFLHVYTNRYTTALVKRWDSKSSQGRKQFFRELKIHFRFKNTENIVAIEGYCSEKDEKIIVFEHAYNRSLDKHLNDTSLSWTKRLNICINVASLLDILHNTDPTGLPSMIHGDIKSGSILIDGDWNAKVFNFEVSAEDGDWVTDKKPHTSLSYIDPQHQGSSMCKDIYSLGVVLLEVLCGKLAWPNLGLLAQRHYKEKGNLERLVFKVIKEQIAQESLIAYQEIALKCIADTEDRQPDGREIVKQLKNALELQVSGFIHVHSGGANEQQGWSPPTLKPIFKANGEQAAPRIFLSRKTKMFKNYIHRSWSHKNTADDPLDPSE